MTRLIYADPQTGETVSAVKHGDNWHVTGAWIRTGGEWVRDAHYFPKWVAHWEASGLVRVHSCSRGVL